MSIVCLDFKGGCGGGWGFGFSCCGRISVFGCGEKFWFFDRNFDVWNFCYVFFEIIFKFIIDFVCLGGGCGGIGGSDLSNVFGGMFFIFYVFVEK